LPSNIQIQKTGAWGRLYAKIHSPLLIWAFKECPPAHHPAVSRSVVAAIFLLLAGMLILPFFQLHSGSISVITFRSAGH
jgi:hypothetical protein